MSESIIQKLDLLFKKKNNEIKNLKLKNKRLQAELKNLKKPKPLSDYNSERFVEVVLRIAKLVIEKTYKVDISTKSRRPEISVPRNILLYYLLTEWKMTPTNLSRELNFDRSSIYNSKKVFDNLTFTDSGFIKDYEKMCKEIKTQVEIYNTKNQ